jgi:hypothetical protein
VTRLTAPPSVRRTGNNLLTPVSDPSEALSRSQELSSGIHAVAYRYQQLLLLLSWLCANYARSRSRLPYHQNSRELQKIEIDFIHNASIFPFSRFGGSSARLSSLSKATPA